MYATTDGHLVPGYLLKGKRRYIPSELWESGKEEDSNKTNVPHQGDFQNGSILDHGNSQQYSREEMARVLEELLKMVKDDANKMDDQKRK
jgi:HAE1 family hydrophobic/amphiphilic exporter-1